MAGSSETTHRRPGLYPVAGVSTAALILVALAGMLMVHPGVSAPSLTPTLTAPPLVLEHLIPEVMSTLPHDNAFTQGLLLDNGYLYESAGLYGESSLRKLDRNTGEVLQVIPLGPAYFAEGLARVDNRLIQLTWREGVAFVYDLDTLEQTGEYTYTGEGWGLCDDGSALYMSDGSSTLIIRNRQTFEPIGALEVRMDSQPVTMLNELECVGPSIFANIWQTDTIVRIDRATGFVTGVIDAAGLLSEIERLSLQNGSVLNGIVYDPAHDTFLITGKRWPAIFEVRFIPYAP